MSDSCCRIERHANGFTVSMRDPEIEKRNNKGKGGWRDPWRSFVFTDIKKLTEFLTENLEKALPADEFDTSYAKALKEDMGDG